MSEKPPLKLHEKILPIIIFLNQKFDPNGIEAGGLNHTWASRGYWAPKYELVPKVTVDQKKRRQAKKSKYEFVLDL